MKAFEKSSSQSKIIYLFIFSLAGLFLAGTLVSLINDLLGGEWVSTVWGLRISSFFQMVLMFFMPAITLIMWSNQHPTAYLKIRKLDRGLLLSLVSFIILLASMPFISLVAELNQMLSLPEWMNGIEAWMQNLEQSAEKTTELLLSGESIVDFLSNLFFIALVAAVAEEVFFRGVLQQLLIKQFKNEHVGVWLGAIIFSMMHLQFYGFLPRVILGALLGYLFLWTRNLWIPILIHFLNNALVVTFNFFLKDNSLYQALGNPAFTISFVLVGFVSLLTAIYVFWIMKTELINDETSTFTTLN